MKRSKHINTFNTTDDYDAYLNSNQAAVPNIAVTKDNNRIHYATFLPSEHLVYGELVDPTGDPIKIRIEWRIGETGTAYDVFTTIIDDASGTFYIDELPDGIINLEIYGGEENVRSLHKISLINSDLTNLFRMFEQCGDMEYCNLTGMKTENVTRTERMFNDCQNLRKLNLSGCDFSNITNQTMMFTQCFALTDVYIDVEATLMKLTGNLTEAYITTGSNWAYIPSTATIHYTDPQGNYIEYKWQNNAWTPQN